MASRPSGVMVRITNDGKVSISPEGPFIFFCKLDMTFFPFDKHHCRLLVEGYRYPTAMQDLKPGKIIFDHYIPDDQWVIQGDGVYYSFVTYEYPYNFSYPYLYFDFIIERKPTYYVLVLLIPFFVIISLELTTFLLPTTSAIRLSISAACQLAFTFYLGVITKELPHSSDRPSILLIAVTGLSVTVAFVEIMQGITIFLSSYFSKSTLKIINRTTITFAATVVIILIVTFSMGNFLDKLRISENT